MLADQHPASRYFAVRQTRLIGYSNDLEALESQILQNCGEIMYFVGDMKASALSDEELEIF